MHLNELDYEIPKELIALHPVKPRDNSKLVVVGKNNRIIKFNEIINELNSSDAIIINNTKVIHAELEGTIDNQKVSINVMSFFKVRYFAGTYILVVLTNTTAWGRH